MARAYRDYRDYLRPKGLKPLRIVRTKKRPGDLVLHHWSKELEIAQ